MRIKRLFSYGCISICITHTCHGSFSNKLSLTKITAMESIIHQDPGNRGLKKLFRHYDLFSATQCLLASKNIAIITGFFIPKANQPETDGPLGACALAKTLLAMRKQVTLITDMPCQKALTACLPFMPRQTRSLSLVVFPEQKQTYPRIIDYLLKKVDCLVSIERVGRTNDGTYLTMHGIDITKDTAPLDELFLEAARRGIATIGVGDGGNEIGMGNIKDIVEANIPKGPTICCVIPVNHLIIAGVSNWGGYALASALACIMRKQDPTHFSADAFFPLNHEQRAMLEGMVKNNCCDGVTLQQAPFVDGLAWEVHEKILNTLRSTIME